MTELLTEAIKFIEEYDLDIRTIEIENGLQPLIHMVGDLNSNIDFFHQFSEYFVENNDSVSYSMSYLVVELA